MRGDNNPPIKITLTENFPLNYLGIFVPDKLTGLLPVLSAGTQEVPLPKVAAHVTGIAPVPEPPLADGEGPLMRYRVKCPGFLQKGMAADGARYASVLLLQVFLGAGGEECASWSRQNLHARSCVIFSSLSRSSPLCSLVLCLLGVQTSVPFQRCSSCWLRLHNPLITQ